MIRSFNGAEAANFPAIFEQMYRQRHAIYVKDRKWTGLPVSGDSLERDEYDNASAVYLLALDESDNVLGGARLLPTTGPHLLAEKFAHLAGMNGVPRGEDIAELTRFYVAPHCRAPRLQYWLTGVVACGLFEYCLENGVRQLSSVIDMFMLNHMLAIGWRVRPLGLPHGYGEGDAIGVLIDITQEGLETARKVRGVEGRVLTTDRTPVPPIRMDIARRASRVAMQSAN